MRSHRAFIVSLLLLGALGSGCGAAEGDTKGNGGDPTKTVRGYGLRIDLPAGWHGEVVRPQPSGGLTLRAATFPIPPATNVGQQAQREMTASDVLITLSSYGWANDNSRVGHATLPLAIERADFAPFEGFARPVATQSRVLDRGAVQLWVVFGDETPSDALLAEANRVLATFTLEPRRLALAGLTVAVGCDRLRKGAHGKEGVERSIGTESVC